MYIVFGANDYSNSGGINDAEGSFTNIGDIAICSYVSLHDSYLVLNTATNIMVNVDLCDVETFENKMLSDEGLTLLTQEMAKVTDDLSKVKLERILDNETGVVGKFYMSFDYEEVVNKEIYIKVYDFNKR